METVAFSSALNAGLAKTTIVGEYGRKIRSTVVGNGEYGGIEKRVL